jgi:hypothetical protein
MNRLRGFGVTFEHDTEAERKRLGLGDLRDPRTMQMQTDYLAKYLARGGSTAPWMGFHGMREADPRWGNSGLVPEKNTSVAGPVAPPKINLPPVAPRANIHIPNVFSGRESSEYPAPGERSGSQIHGALAKHGAELRKMFGERGPQKAPIERPAVPGEQDVSLRPGDLSRLSERRNRPEPGSLLRAADQRQAAASAKHEVTGSASLHVKLAAGLAPASALKTKGNLFKETRLDRAPLPLASTMG